MHNCQRYVHAHLKVTNPVLHTKLKCPTFRTSNTNTPRIIDKSRPRIIEVLNSGNSLHQNSSDINARRWMNPKWSGSYNEHKNKNIKRTRHVLIMNYCERSKMIAFLDLSNKAVNNLSSLSEKQNNWKKKGMDTGKQESIFKTKNLDWLFICQMKRETAISSSTFWHALNHLTFTILLTFRFKHKPTLINRKKSQGNVKMK